MSDSLELWMLGPWQARLRGAPLPPLPTRHARALLARLALAHPQPVKRQQLMVDLFPQADPPSAARLLRTTLYYLRRVLRTDIHGDGKTVALDQALLVEHDLSRFEAGTSPGAGLSALVAAIREYRGEFLDVPPAGWAEQQAQRLHDRYIYALRRAVVLAQANGTPELGLDAAQRWVAEEPWDDEARAAYSTALEATGGTRPIMLPAPALPAAVVDSAAFDRLPLVGRAGEMRQLARAWTTARDGQAGALILEGSAGIGKTRLVQAWIASDDVRKTGLVFWGIAHEQTGSRPLGPLLDALARPAPSTRLALQEACALVDDLTWNVLQLDLPAIQQYQPRRPVRQLPRLEPQAEELRRSTAWTTFLDAICVQAPVVLVLENAHQADAETIRLIETLTGSPRRLLAVLTRRPISAEEVPSLPRLPLAPLEHTDMRHLIVAALGNGPENDLHARLAAWSGGVPLFAREILQTLIARRAFHWDPGAGWKLRADHVELPHGVIDLLGQRLAPLSPPALQLARLLAVLARPADEALLSRLVPDTTVHEELLRHHVLRAPGPTTEALHWFSHDWLGETLLGTLDVESRQHAHQQIAEALEQGAEPDPAEMMQHWAGAGAWSAALHSSLAAAEHALAETRLPALDRALVLAERAADMLGWQMDDPKRKPLLFLRESHLTLAEHGPRWQQHLRMMATLGGLSHDPEYRAELCLRQGMAMRQQDNKREAERLLHQAAKLAHDIGYGETESKAYFGLAQVLDDQNEDLPAVLTACQAAARAAEGLPDPGLYMRALLGTAYAYARNGQARQAAQLLDSLLATPLCAKQPALRARAERYQGFIWKELRHYERAIAAHRRSVQDFDTIGDQFGSLLSRNNLLIVLCEAGQYEISRMLGLENRAMARRLGSQDAESGALWYLALAEYYSGQCEPAWEAIQECIAIVETLSSSANLAQMLHLGAIIALATVRCAEARQYAERSLALPVPPKALVHFLNPMVLFQLGERARAYALAHELLESQDPRTLGNIFNLQDYWDAAAVVTHVDGREAARPWQERAYARLMEDIAAFSSARDRHTYIAATPANREMASWRSHGPRRLVYLPHPDAPTGRPLQHHELVPVVWTLHEPDDPVPAVARRQRQLVRLTAEAIAQNAVATVEALAVFLAVASRTILRDLQELRANGTVIVTRASVGRKGDAGPAPR